MRRALIIRSFLPFAVRFLSRHPTKLSRLRQHWIDYVGRFGKMAELTKQDMGRVEAVFYELECSEPLFNQLNGLRGIPLHSIVYYGLVRLMQPDLVVETGVGEGFSSRFLLLAMMKNKRGTLHSIDLPNHTDVLPEGRHTGWLVPTSLRDRWRLNLGDSRELLPKLLETLGSIDIFIHDSLHTYDHMLFEFQTAWPYLRKGGFLLSDNIDLNKAFPKFASTVQCSPILFNIQVGAIRKS